jgi:hypothetical protein
VKGGQSSKKKRKKKEKGEKRKRNSKIRIPSISAFDISTSQGLP